MKKVSILLLLGIVVGFVLFLLLFPVLQKTTRHIALKINSQACHAFTVVSPTKDTPFTSPLHITAEVDNSNSKCHWTVFEGQAGTATLYDDDGKVLGQDTLKTTEDWMQSKKVTYNAVVTFKRPVNGGKGVLKFTEENPSGTSDAQEIMLLVRF